MRTRQKFHRGAQNAQYRSVSDSLAQPRQKGECQERDYEAQTPRELIRFILSFRYSQISSSFKGRDVVNVIFPLKNCEGENESTWLRTLVEKSCEWAVNDLEVTSSILLSVVYSAPNFLLENAKLCSFL